jgi:hypothetical protein
MTWTPGYCVKTGQSLKNMFFQFITLELFKEKYNTFDITLQLILKMTCEKSWINRLKLVSENNFSEYFCDYKKTLLLRPSFFPVKLCKR